MSIWGPTAGLIFFRVSVDSDLNLKLHTTPAKRSQRLGFQKTRDLTAGGLEAETGRAIANDRARWRPIVRQLIIVCNNSWDEWQVSVSVSVLSQCWSWPSSGLGLDSILSWACVGLGLVPVPVLSRPLPCCGLGLVSVLVLTQSCLGLVSVLVLSQCLPWPSCSGLGLVPVPVLVLSQCWSWPCSGLGLDSVLCRSWTWPGPGLVSVVVLCRSWSCLGRGLVWVLVLFRSLSCLGHRLVSVLSRPLSWSCPRPGLVSVLVLSRSRQRLGEH